MTPDIADAVLKVGIFVVALLIGVAFGKLGERW
jgi:hypothetical protein